MRQSLKFGEFGTRITHTQRDLYKVTEQEQYRSAIAQANLATNY